MIPAPSSSAAPGGHGFLRAAAVYGEPRVLAVFFLGFSSGLPLALTASTLSIWLSEAGVDRATIGLFALAGLPYLFKFVWAPLVDHVPLPVLTRAFGRRRAWMLFTQALLITAIAVLAQTGPAVNPGATAVAALMVAFCSATQDIVIDAFRVESLDEDQLAAGAASVTFGYRIGMLVAGAGALYLATAHGWTAAYQFMAALVLVGVVTVLVRPEPETGVPAASPGAGVGEWFSRAVVAPFADFTARRGWIAILAFIALYKFGDSLAGVMTGPFLIETGFSKNEIATVSKLFGFWATMAGLAVGGMLMIRAGLFKSLWICGILQLLSNFMFAVQAMVGADIGLLALTIGLENFAGGMGTAVFVAYLSKLCNISYTATQYALLSALSATARTLLSSSAGFLANGLGWVGFFVLTAGAAVPGLLLLWWLWKRAPERAGVSK